MASFNKRPSTTYALNKGDVLEQLLQAARVSDILEQFLQAARASQLLQAPRNHRAATTRGLQVARASQLLQAAQASTCDGFPNFMPEQVDHLVDWDDMPTPKKDIRTTDASLEQAWNSEAAGFEIMCLQEQTQELEDELEIAHRAVIVENRLVGALKRIYNVNDDAMAQIVSDVLKEVQDEMIKDAE